MKLLIAIISLLLFTSVTIGEPEKILWSETNKLTWSDFKGTPDAGSNFVASTNSGMSFSFSYSIRNDEVSYNFTNESFFYPEMSWYKKGNVSDYILAHEQTHFDISELHSRIFKKRMEEGVFTKNIKKEVNELYKEVESERIAMQSRYDDETNHSQIIEAENRWRNYVAEQLQVYVAWK